MNVSRKDGKGKIGRRSERKKIFSLRALLTVNRKYERISAKEGYCISQREEYHRQHMGKEGIKVRGDRCIILH